MKQFPKGFYWGAATASYQVEGGIENTDWAKAARERKVPEAGLSSDHYNRYEEDFDIAKELGHNAHRFSVEWARIEPEEGKCDPEAIEHYKKVLTALRERNIEPFITLWHFTLPLWFSESGGFERQDSPEIFARFCKHVVAELGEHCQHFTTINEPIVFASNGWLRGYWPPFQRFSVMNYLSFSNSDMSQAEKGAVGIRPLLTYIRVRKHLERAHIEAYTEIKKQNPNTCVSIVRDLIVFDANINPLNKLVAWLASWHWNSWGFKKVYDHCDEIGLNYYFYKKFGDKKEHKKTDMGWDFQPEKIYHALMMLKRYKKPVFVSEAGLADADDTDRAEYITKQIEGTRLAMDEGVEVRGHMYWSLLDNYEWALGYEKRFGLVEINYETLERKIRPSAYVYKKIIEDNGIHLG